MCITCWKYQDVLVWFVTTVGEFSVVGFHPALPLNFMCDLGISTFILLGLGFLILCKARIVSCEPSMGPFTV